MTLRCLAAFSGRWKCCPYEPSPLEIQISAVALDLLRSIPSDSNGDAWRSYFARRVQALCDPVALFEIASELATGDGNARPDPRTFEASAVLDYDEHEALLAAMWFSIRGSSRRVGFKTLIGLLRAAMETREPQRISALKAYLRRALEGGAAKVLVFAGTYGAAESVADLWWAPLGEAVASFRHDLADDKKEEEVSRFRRDTRLSRLGMR